MFANAESSNGFRILELEIKSKTHQEKLAGIREKESDIDADSIIGPIMEPIALLFSEIDKNDRALQMAHKFEQQRKASSFDPESFLAILNPKEEPLTTPASFLNKLFEPMKHEFEKFQATMSSSQPAIPSPQETSPEPPKLINNESVRKAQPSPLPNIFESEKVPEPIKNLFPDISRPETYLYYPPTVPTLPPLKLSNEKPKNLMEYLMEEFKPDNPENREGPFGLTYKPVSFGNPFTLNPLMSLFTTPAPLFKIPNIPQVKGIPVHKIEHLPIFHKPNFKFQDPFYNPLLPNRRSKLYDILTGVSTLPPLLNLLKN